MAKAALLAAAMLAVSVAAPGAFAQDGATALVAEFQQGLLAVMKDARTLGVKGRAERIAPVIEGAFNLPVMIATASAPHWKSAPADQRETLLSAFRRMSAASAATLFDGYGGESFRVLGERKGQGPTVLIDTQIVRPNDDPVNITYVAARIRDRWWLIDIIVGGGISELTVRQSEYQALLRDGGVPRLMEALRQKTENLLAGREKARAERGS